MKPLTRDEWIKLLWNESDRCLQFKGRVCVNVNGGDGSAVTWARCLEWYGADRVLPVFADTNSEHPDLYRFLDDCEKKFGQTLTRLNDGRNIWDVFDKSGMIRIAKAGGACKASIELKQRPLAKFAKEHEVDAIAVGIEFMEPDRIARFSKKLAPMEVLFPLTVRPRLSECEMHDEVRALGLTPPSVYSEGQPHNNCRKYGCILAGVSQWAADVTLNPEGFDYSAAREQVFNEKTGFAVCRDRTGGTTKPYPLKQLKEDVLNGKTFNHEWKSQCACMEPQPTLFSADECFGDLE